MNLIQCRSISEALGVELSRRKQKNASYSLRAFARDLNLSASSLSTVLSGRTGLSPRSLHKVVSAISKNESDQQYLADLVLRQFAKNQSVRKQAEQRIAIAKKSFAYRKLKAEQFKIVSQWYHGALLELIQLSEFDSSPEWIADALGITPAEAKSAIHRLESLKMIERRPGEKHLVSPNAFSVFSDTPDRAVKKFHTEILKRHTDSLWNDDLEKREFLSTFVAIPSSRLGELKQILRGFFMTFWKEFEADPKDELYSLSLQFCPAKRRSDKTLAKDTK